MMAAASAALLSAVAAAALTGGEGDIRARVQLAVGHLREGRLAQAEACAADVASDVESAGSARAWAIVAAARERRGDPDGARRAYRLLLARCESPSLREYATRRIAACERLAARRRPPAAPSRRLDDERLAALRRVDDRVYAESSEHFVVRARNAELAKLLAEEAEVALRRVCRLVLGGRAYPHSVEIHVWPDGDAYAANAPQAAPEWSGGAYSLTSRNGLLIRRIDLTQLDERGRFATVMLDRVLPHEMCHLVMRELFGDAPSPLFLQEGLAMLAEAEPDADRIVLAGAALTGDAGIPLSDLLVIDRYDIENRAVYYAESYSLVSFLRRRLTTDQFDAFLAHVKNGCTTVDALERALYSPPGEDFPSKLAGAWADDAVAQAQMIRALRGESVLATSDGAR